MAKVLVYGWYSKENCGDESYKISFGNLFADHSLTFTEKIDDELIQSHDAFILGGGNILDSHHLKTVQKHKAYLSKIPCIAFSVGQTDDKIQESQLSIFQSIYIRDLDAFSRLQKMHPNVHYCPDAAFAMEPNPTRGSAIWNAYFEDKDLYEKKVAVIANSHLISGSTDVLSRDALRFQMFSLDLATIIDNTNASFLFVPFGCSMPWDDRVANGWIASQCKWFRKTATIYDKFSVQANLDVIAAADVVISLRYHSTVFSVIAGVPFVDVYHHDKNHSFLKTLGLESWGVSFWDFSREKTKEILDSHLDGSSNSKDRIRCIKEEQKQRLQGEVNGIYFN